MEIDMSDTEVTIGGVNVLVTSLNIETWTDVLGYEGFYQVSDCGRVKSLKRKGRLNDKIIKPREDNRGYLMTTLHKDGDKKNVKVHRLVASSFLGPQDLIINHMDLDKKNNNLENLEYLTQSENLYHYYNARKNHG